MVVGVVLFIANLFILRDYNQAIVATAVTIILLVAAFVFWTKRYCRSAVCPRCDRRLPRDPNSPRGELHYRCDDCGVVWVSEIRSMG
ncbi:MAG: hypothetical protein QM754_20225 [Tepidisphaeraceae bacterium]